MKTAGKIERIKARRDDAMYDLHQLTLSALAVISSVDDKLRYYADKVEPAIAEIETIAQAEYQKL